MSIYDNFPGNITKNPTRILVGFYYKYKKNQQRPTLPRRYHLSTISAEGLNFCVRYGNRCDPFAIATRLTSFFEDKNYNNIFIDFCQ